MHARSTRVGRARADEAPPLFTRTEITVMFGVNAKTVTRWVRAGRVSATRRPGGTMRYRADEISALLAHDRGDQSLP
jgi:predicted site-specific integrase-resolvase